MTNKDGEIFFMVTLYVKGAGAWLLPYLFRVHGYPDLRMILQCMRNVQCCIQTWSVKTERQSDVYMERDKMLEDDDFDAHDYKLIKASATEGKSKFKRGGYPVVCAEPLCADWLAGLQFGKIRLVCLPSAHV